MNDSLEREEIATFLQARIREISETVATSLQLNPSDIESVVALIQEGKQCQSTLDHINTLSDEALYAVSHKIADKYGVRLLKARRLPALPRRQRVNNGFGYTSIATNHHGQKVQIMPGDKFGMLTVVRELPPTYYSKIGHEQQKGVPMRRFELRCDCGSDAFVYMCNLRSGKVRNCRNCSTRCR